MAPTRIPEMLDNGQPTAAAELQTQDFSHSQMPEYQEVISSDQHVIFEGKYRFNHFVVSQNNIN